MSATHDESGDWVWLTAPDEQLRPLLGNPPAVMTRDDDQGAEEREQPPVEFSVWGVFDAAAGCVADLCGDPPAAP